ncbi:m48 family [Nannochloropsis oceanica]
MLVAGLLLVPTGLGGAFFVSHLESAPLTGRTQLVFLNTTQEMELGVMAASLVYKAEKEHILPRSAPETIIVHDISAGLLKSLKQQIQGQGEDAARLRDRITDMQWEVSVIDSDVVNAFVVPSGSIFVYTGLLKQVQTTGALAFILGHEISHALARHSVEKMGILCVGSFFVDFCAGFLGSSAHRYLQYMLLPYLQALILDLPFSRRLETEADVLGVQLMANAGYDPQEAIEAWKRMEQGEEHGGGGRKAMEFVSTHPSHHTRIERLTALLPKARAMQQQAVRVKLQRGEKVPDSKQSISPSSSMRHGRTSKEVEAIRQRRREESAQTALRASSLIPPPPPE